MASRSEHPERVEFRVDSTYAINIATGKFRLPAQGKGNWELAARLRDALRRLQVTKGHYNVSIVHVRSHTGDVGNEIADILAKEGTELNEEMAQLGLLGRGRAPHVRARAAAAPQSGAA